MKKPELLTYSEKDEIGQYTELTGLVVKVGELSGYFEWEEVEVDVKTEKGIFTGYTPRPPKVGYWARIKLYRCGGGWYPDDRIVGWSIYPYDPNVVAHYKGWCDKDGSMKDLSGNENDLNAPKPKEVSGWWSKMKKVVERVLTGF